METNEQVTVVLRPVRFYYMQRVEVRYTVLAKQDGQVAALFPYTFLTKEAARKATRRLAS